MKQTKIIVMIQPITIILLCFFILLLEMESYSVAPTATTVFCRAKTALLSSGKKISAEAPISTLCNYRTVAQEEVRVAKKNQTD